MPARAVLSYPVTSTHQRFSYWCFCLTLREAFHNPSHSITIQLSQLSLSLTLTLSSPSTSHRRPSPWLSFPLIRLRSGRRNYSTPNHGPRLYQARLRPLRRLICVPLLVLVFVCASSRCGFCSGHYFCSYECCCSCSRRTLGICLARDRWWPQPIPGWKGHGLVPSPRPTNQPLHQPGGIPARVELRLVDERARRHGTRGRDGGYGRTVLPLSQSAQGRVGEAVVAQGGP